MIECKGSSEGRRVKVMPYLIIFSLRENSLMKTWKLSTKTLLWRSLKPVQPSELGS